MSAIDTLRTILSGERPDGGVLQTCRLELDGAEAYGEEAILERLRVAPFAMGRNADWIAGERHVASAEGDCAVFADIYGDEVARIWCLRPGEPARPEPAVAVAFDPDLSQTRGDVSGQQSDHPDLQPGAFPHLIEAGRRLAYDSETPGYRARAFLIRAFSAGNRHVGLFAVHRLGPGPERAAGFSSAIAVLRTDGPALLSAHMVRDRAGEAAAALSPSLHRV
jgi:hypothetical protein